jgi:hypothetical protein
MCFSSVNDPFASIIKMHFLSSIQNHGTSWIYLFAPRCRARKSYLSNGNENGKQLDTLLLINSLPSRPIRRNKSVSLYSLFLDFTPRPFRKKRFCTFLGLDSLVF